MTTRNVIAMHETQFEGDGTWQCVWKVDGDDLVAKGIRCTWFGGEDDPDDTGKTASGISTKDSGVVGCALPMSKVEPKACPGSPIRWLPWGTRVKVYNRANGATVFTELIDVGPAKRRDGSEQGNIDVTPEAMRMLWRGNMHGDAMVDARIIGGALVARRGWK